ncbi:hypothetical protein UMC2_26221 [[Clostridium] sordellii]|nr:hypothetical protein UMC2_26221 [[Clostridium] sordellii] [Paeniclostridium sordellii]
MNKKEIKELSDKMIALEKLLKININDILKKEETKIN